MNRLSYVSFSGLSKGTSRRGTAEADHSTFRVGLAKHSMSHALPPRWLYGFFKAKRRKPVHAGAQWARLDVRGSQAPIHSWHKNIGLPLPIRSSIPDFLCPAVSFLSNVTGRLWIVQHATVRLYAVVSKPPGQFLAVCRYVPPGRHFPKPLARHLSPAARLLLPSS